MAMCCLLYFAMGHQKLSPACLGKCFDHRLCPTSGTAHAISNFVKILNPMWRQSRAVAGGWLWSFFSVAGNLWRMAAVLLVVFPTWFVYT